MIPKEKSIQSKESNPQRIAGKLKVIGNSDRIDNSQPEGSYIKAERYNNVIPFKLKSSRKVNDRKSDLHENASVDAKVDQGLIVKQVLNNAINDQDFWVDLLEHGSAALSKFSLSNEAKAAIASGDVRWFHDNVGDIQEREMAFLYKRLEREAW